MRRLLSMLWAVPASLSSFALFLALQRSAFLKGTDAYYYALQIDWWSLTGRVRIPDGSWIFPFLGFLQRLGASTETAFNGWIAGSLLLASTCLFFADPRAPSSRRAAAAVWASLSPLLLFTAVEFPKMFFVAATLPLWAFDRGRARAVLTVAAMGLAFWAHRSALPLILAFLLGVGLDGKRKLPILAGAGLLAAAGIVLNFSRLSSALTLSAPGLFSLVSRESLPTALRVEIVFFAGVFAFYFFQKALRPSSSVPFAHLLPGWIAFLPFGGDEVFSVGERCALFLPVVGLLLWQRASEATKAVFPAAFALGLFAAFFPGTKLDLAHPAALERDHEPLRRAVRSLAPMEIPMLIAPKDAAFFYKYALRREAFPYEPEDHWDKTRVRRLVTHIRPEELWPYLPEACRSELATVAGEFLLTDEACWEEARGRIDAEQDSDLYQRAWNHVWNPSRKRPAFLYPKHADDDPNEEFPASPRINSGAK